MSWNESTTSDRRLTGEENKMRVLLNVRAERNFFSVEQYVAVRDFLQSPLGAKLLDEIVAGRRECHHCDDTSPSDQSVTGLRDSLVTGTN